jgi:hypothetical protein
MIINIMIEMIGEIKEIIMIKNKSKEDNQQKDKEEK